MSPPQDIGHRTLALTTLGLPQTLSPGLFPPKHSLRLVSLDAHLTVTHLCPISRTGPGAPSHSSVLSSPMDQTPEETPLTKWQDWDQSTSKAKAPQHQASSHPLPLSQAFPPPAPVLLQPQVTPIRGGVWPLLAEPCSVLQTPRPNLCTYGACCLQCPFPLHLPSHLCSMDSETSVPGFKSQLHQ